MNRKELEKMFDNKFLLFTPIYEDYININNEVKDFIFDTIITEVLKSVFEYEKNKNKNEGIVYWDFKEYFKQQVKEKFNINL